MTDTVESYPEDLDAGNYVWDYGVGSITSDDPGAVNLFTGIFNISMILVLIISVILIYRRIKIPQLRLKVKKLDYNDGVCVSWNDLKFNKIGQGISAVFSLMGFVSVFMVFQSDMTIWYAGAVMFPLLSIMNFNVQAGRNTKVFFTRKGVEFRGEVYTSGEVTRFDYGKMSDLSGNKPLEGEPDPSILRMWVNDSYAVILGENKWDLATNHMIRDCLDKALREFAASASRMDLENQYGKVSDDGLPDYD